MKFNQYLLIAFFVFSFQYVNAQKTSTTIYPIVQKANFKNKSFKINALKINAAKGLKKIVAKTSIKNYLTNDNKEATLLNIGILEDKNSKKYLHEIENKQGAYYLKTTPEEITIAAHDSIGVFYALQTLSQLLHNKTLAVVEIKDFPNTAYRGVVEGFYGTPWSQKNRISQLEFYGKIKANTYIYGPKDDPYHSSPNWRKAYPSEQANQIKELVQVAKNNYVDFVWAIHPGQDIKWNEEDQLNVLHKFENMYALGVRSFAVFFDDISGEGTDAHKQAALLNYLTKEFVLKNNGVKPLIMCPTEYNKSWANPKPDGYLSILGNELEPSIQVMWTGDKVVADITISTLEWINQRIKRPALIWWNFPVSDYVRNHLLMGKSYGLDTKITNQMSGILSNPMEHAEASKFGIFGLADYAWNISAYQADSSWKQSFTALMPKSASEMHFFAENNSDPGVNGHNYRREESVSIAAPIAELTTEIKNKKINKAHLKHIEEYFHQMSVATNKLLEVNENPDLITDIKPWLVQFDLLGQLGTEALKVADQKIDTSSQINYWKNVLNLFELNQKAQELSKKGNENPFQAGIKTGTLVLQPFVASLLNWNADRMYQFIKPAQISPVKPLLGSISSNSETLKNATLLNGIDFIYIKPILEITKINPNDYFILNLPYELNSGIIKTNLGIKDYNWASIEISNDAKHWINVSREDNEEELVNTIDNTPFKYVRLQNIGLDTVAIRLKNFSVQNQLFNPIHNISSTTDHNLSSYFLLKALKVQTMLLPKNSNGKYKILKSDQSSIKINVLSNKKMTPIVLKNTESPYLEFQLPENTQEINISGATDCKIYEII